MFVCLDVDYRSDHAQVSSIVFKDPKSDDYVVQTSSRVFDIQPYVPGQFYKRELPCLLAALKEVANYPIDCIIVDSYVWLAKDTPGMGHHLYEALDKKIPVIGVAKTHFKTDDISIPVTRGESKSPLFVTAIGMPIDDAAVLVSTMHGDYRIPTLLKKVDQLCRIK